MRKIIGVAVSCFVACSLFLIVQPAFGALDSSVVWRPDQTEEPMDAVAINLTHLGTDVEFGLYDYDETSDQMIIFPNSAEEPYANLYFRELEGDWVVSLVFISDEITLLSELSEPYVNLGSTYEFGFYFKDTSTTIPGDATDDFGIVAAPTTEWGTDQTYTLNWDDHIVIVNDVEPKVVPIPTAMLLLSSGLVGLAGFKRKMDY